MVALAEKTFWKGSANVLSIDNQCSGLMFLGSAILDIYVLR